MLRFSFSLLIQIYIPPTPKHLCQRFLQFSKHAEKTSVDIAFNARTDFGKAFLVWPHLFNDIHLIGQLFMDSRHKSKIHHQ